MKLRTKVYVFLGVLVVASVVWVLVKPDTGTPVFEAVKVERGEVYHEVSVTGHVEPVTRVALAFPNGGRITQLLVEEGEFVEKGAPIAFLDTQQTQSTLIEAEARLAGEQARLRDLLAPLRTEEKALKDSAVVNAEQSLKRTEETSRATLARAFMYADDAIHEKADELFESKNSGDPDMGVTFSYGTTKYFLKADAATQTELNTRRAKIETTLQEMKARADDTEAGLDEALLTTSYDLLYIEDFLTLLASVINDYASEDTYDQTVYETFQTSITSARTAVSAVRGEVLAANSAYSASQATLTMALRDLELADAGASDEVISTQEASVAAARAGVEAVATQVADSVLRAPLQGVVTKLYPEVGEIVSPYEDVAEIITDGTFEVEAFIPEADIARVKLGDQAKITFDAFEENQIFEAEVTRIALSETVREGVPTYKTTLKLADIDREGVHLRAGMTADIEIRTDVHERVLFVPIRSVLRDGARTYVRVFQDGAFQEKDIVTGLRGSEGTIEVVSGLSEGEEIVLYVEEA